MMRASRLAAVAVVAALGGAVAMMAENPAVESVPDEPSRSATTATALRLSASSTRPIATTTITAVATPSTDDPVQTVVEGLAAWGRFAVTGDLDQVEPWFWVDGPQYARFVQEAKDLAAQPVGGQAYTVTVEPADVSAAEEDAHVSGRIVFARTGEPSQSFSWVVVLRRGSGMWKIWTVDDQETPDGRG
ncbi:MAG TPA: hypothetical protein VHL52_12785 [Acidimicrobiia bacterium]|nr:hypothetical protein [Acidimicrobiia bacterium]